MRGLLREEQGVLDAAQTAAKDILDIIIDGIKNFCSKRENVDELDKKEYVFFMDFVNFNALNGAVESVVYRVHLMKQKRYPDIFPLYKENYYDTSHKQIALTIILIEDDKGIRFDRNMIPIIAHELVHAYQSNIAHIKKNRYYSKVAKLLRNNPNPKLKDFYFAIYYFTIGEINANANRLYAELSDFPRKPTFKECTKLSKCYREFLSTKSKFVNAISLINNDMKFQDKINFQLGDSYESIKKYALNNLRVAQTKFDKVIGYYLSTGGLTEQAMRMGPIFHDEWPNQLKAMTEEINCL